MLLEALHFLPQPKWAFLACAALLSQTVQTPTPAAASGGNWQSCHNLSCPKKALSGQMYIPYVFQWLVCCSHLRFLHCIHLWPKSIFTHSKSQESLWPRWHRLKRKCIYIKYRTREKMFVGGYWPQEPSMSLPFHHFWHASSRKSLTWGPDCALEFPELQTVKHGNSSLRVNPSIGGGDKVWSFTTSSWVNAHVWKMPFAPFWGGISNK